MWQVGAGTVGMAADGVLVRVMGGEKTSGDELPENGKGCDARVNGRVQEKSEDRDGDGRRVIGL
jgi:hypothetical protein